MNSTWLITSELANQRARKALFTYVVYTNQLYTDVIIVVLDFTVIENGNRMGWFIMTPDNIPSEVL